MTDSVTTIPVQGDTPDNRYDVLVGNGLLGKVPELLGERVKKVLIIHPRALRATGDVVKNDLEAVGLTALTAEIPDA